MLKVIVLVDNHQPKLRTTINYDWHISVLHLCRQLREYACGGNLQNDCVRQTHLEDTRDYVKDGYMFMSVNDEQVFVCSPRFVRSITWEPWRIQVDNVNLGPRFDVLEPTE